MSNPSTSSCECDKYCEVDQYLDYKNCVCRKKKSITWLNNVIVLLI